jgi:membrane protein implicated in regulation of membrane protease activity
LFPDTGERRVYSGETKSMWLLYLLALILGGGLLLVQMLAGGHGHDVDHDLGHADDTHPYEGPGLLSIRSAMYGVFTFGLVGGALHVLGLARPGWALAAGVTTGLLTMLFVGLTFKHLGDPAASGEAGFHEARGRRGRVLVACSREHRGKIRVLLKGQHVDILATTDEESIPVGSEVVVAEVRDDVAHVRRAGEEGVR